MLLEGDRLASGASGRNGGFCSASLTHGVANGMARWPEEMAMLEHLGRENLAGIREAIQRYAIACDFEETGEITVATEPHQEPWLDEEAHALRQFGWNVEVVGATEMQTRIHSPTYRGGVWLKDGCALLNPARLCWGLAAAAETRGAVIHERTPVISLSAQDNGIVARTESGTVNAKRVFLATSAFPPLVRSLRHYIVPVYDYVLVTEPLDIAQLRSIGWEGRQGLSDMGNQFHYYRLTDDNRILWGGYDAIYHFRNGTGPACEQRPRTFERLAEHFFATFPQLQGLSFSHRWGGAIDTCSRFSAMFGTAMEGRVAYAIGFTGLGVGASRFGARVALDLLDGRDTERTRLQMVKRKPIPFPPEPLRYAAIQFTRHELDRADRNGGNRGIWLRALDRLGLGFDS